MKAIDKGLPTKRTSSNFSYVTVIVQRNQNSPIFFPSTYTERIPETTAIGTDVVTVAATDNDTIVSSLNFYT